MWSSLPRAIYPREGACPISDGGWGHSGLDSALLRAKDIAGVSPLALGLKTGFQEVQRIVRSAKGLAACVFPSLHATRPFPYPEHPFGDFASNVYGKLDELNCWRYT